MQPNAMLFITCMRMSKSVMYVCNVCHSQCTMQLICWQIIKRLMTISMRKWFPSISWCSGVWAAWAHTTTGSLTCIIGWIHCYLPIMHSMYSKRFAIRTHKHARASPSTSTSACKVKKDWNIGKHFIKSNLWCRFIYGLWLNAFSVRILCLS